VTTAPLALTLGDPDGIGPEIALKAWQAQRDCGPRFALLADPAHAFEAARLLDLPRPEPVASWVEASAAFADALPVMPLPAADGARAALDSIDAGVAAVLSGDASAQMGQVGVKTPGIVRDGLPHSALDWADWETPVWEE